LRKKLHLHVAEFHNTTQPMHVPPPPPITVLISIYHRRIKEFHILRALIKCFFSKSSDSSLNATFQNKKSESKKESYMQAREKTILSIKTN
jgi:hypothetical protein